MTFQEHLSSLFPDKRKEPWERFLQLGLPTKEFEQFKYVRLQDLCNNLFLKPTEKEREFELKPSLIVFRNGKYLKGLSSPPKGLIALSLNEAFSTYGMFLAGRLKTQLQSEKDPFVLLNAALYDEGLFLYLPPRAKCEAPLHILHIVDSPSAIVFPQIVLFMGKDSCLELIVEQNVEAQKTFSNALIDLTLEEGAFLQITLLANEESSSWHFDAIRASLKKESKLEAFAVTNGALVSRQDYNVRLMDEKGECSLNGVWKLRSSLTHHVNVLMKHEAPFCTSLQTFKGALADVSKSSFEGKIYVSKDAQKTSAYQRNHNLLLGKHACANAKPNLEIFADDVKASHGATVGNLNEDDLFYLKSRGIAEEQAKEILVLGFIGEILDKIPEPWAREKAKKIVT